jgi:hypothetical protein
VFLQTVLKNTLTREKIIQSTNQIADADKNITNIFDEDGLFDELIHVENISKTKIDEWNTKSHTALKDGLNYSSLCEVNIWLKNTQFILDFCHSLY